jgi:hypothetical protein
MSQGFIQSRPRKLQEKDVLAYHTAIIKGTDVGPVTQSR